MLEVAAKGETRRPPPLTKFCPSDNVSGEWVKVGAGAGAIRAPDGVVEKSSVAVGGEWPSESVLLDPEFLSAR